MMRLIAEHIFRSGETGVASQLLTVCGHDNTFIAVTCTRSKGSPRREGCETHGRLQKSQQSWRMSIAGHSPQH